MTHATDIGFMQRAIELALASEREGNLPIGALITLEGEVIGEGKSSVLEPEYDPGRHAEIEAIRDVETALWPQAARMTCYTTLEPCVMCAGTLLLHGVGRVVFGAHDTLGGAGCVLDHLPPYYDEGGVFAWEGPLMPEQCDALYQRADAVFASLPVGRDQWSKPDRVSPQDCLETLESWRSEQGAVKLKDARKAAASFARLVDDELVGEVLPYAQAIFERTGYLKDFRALKRYARRASRPDALDEVDAAVRVHLPDIWIQRALSRGDTAAAIACWYENEEHRRARLSADKLVAACGAEDPDLLVSCRMSTINYLIGRRQRRHYRRACAELRKLRDELRRAGREDYWPFVLEDLTTRFASRPALLDELRKAGFLS